MSVMPALSKMSTFFTTTLFCLYTLLLRLFLRRPTTRHTSSVTPYPLAPDLEGRVIETGGGSHSICAEKETDLEQGIFTNCVVQTDLVSLSREAASQQGAPHPRGIARAMFRSSFSGSNNIKDKTPVASPLSLVTNTVRAGGSPHKRAASRTAGENTGLPSRKPTPLRRMPRYLNLTGSSPTKPALSIKQSPDNIKSRRSSLACPRERAVPRKSVSFATAESSPCISPVKFEPRQILCRPAGASIDLAARVRSAFYKHGCASFDAHESARDLFDRDTLYSRSSVYSRSGSARDSDEEDDYGTPLRLRSTYSPPSPSKLPYLRDSVASDARTSMSSSVFNDFIASVERKYPAFEWTDIVQLDLSAREEPHAPSNGDGAEEPWSDVFRLEDYGACPAISLEPVHCV